MSEPHLMSSAALAPRIAAVLAAHPDVAVGYLFGSVARGEARPDSDLDVGIVFLARGTDPSGIRTARIAAEIGRATGFEAVDVVDLEAQGPIFCHRVLLEGQAIHTADRARRVDFESDTIVHALDFRPTYELATQGKITALRRWLEPRYDL